MSEVSSLPRSANLKQLKNQAKDLLRAFRSGEPDAVRELAEGHPRIVSPDAAKLTDAQLVLARRYGFNSWPKLRLETAGAQLRRAIWDRNPGGVAEVLESEPESLDRSGAHPMWGGRPDALQVAAERGHVETVALLLDRGADVNATGEYGWSPVHLAANWGHTEVAGLLLDRGAKMDIFLAALLGNKEETERLLNENPSSAATNGLNSAPPLHVAGNPEIAQLLLDRGASLDTVDELGNTPLGSAISRRSRQVARFLVERGAIADPCQLAALGDRARLSELLDSDPSAISYRGRIGVNAVLGTPLHAATHAGDFEIVSELLERGADPNSRADSGQTPLHNCSSQKVAQLLIEAGADPRSVDDEYGTTPLTWANRAIEIQGHTTERAEVVAYLKRVTPTP
jgi:ankyrin repeat protein